MRWVTSIGLMTVVLVAAGVWSTGSAGPMQGPAQLGTAYDGLITHPFSGGTAGDHLLAP